MATNVSSSTITVTLEVPETWMRNLAVDRAALLEIFRLGLLEYRIRRAISLYRSGLGSLSYAAEVVGLPRRILLEEARKYGLEPDYDEESFHEDLQK